ncbi:uncharacterized protein LOC132739347 [Ruditapes philippinarum]|uniref:uncharacterized protein LOC132739347 n=1 Tax=Ruditapes philippinarum TaxID=129788 RepID=UPI00295B59E2|nr:uncharacterized protein LOC132739347 [Ruditapes philippinarum]
MASFGNMFSKCYIFAVLFICKFMLIRAVPVEPVCSKFSYDEQLLEKMVRMEFFVENMQKEVEKSVSNVMDLMIGIKGNNSELSDRFSEQQDKIDNLERQTDVLSETMANKSIVSENMQSTRNMTVVVGNIIKDLEESTSGLDNLKVITDEINKKCEDGLSDMNTNLERQMSVLSVTMANKSVVSENMKSIKSMALNVENIKKDLEKSTSGLDDLKTVTGEVKATCKDGLLDLSNKFAALEKQIKELDQATEKKTQTVAFNVMDAISFTDREPVKFSNVIFNEGDAYNKDTGMFTAPTDGIYQFNAHICGKKDAGEIEYYIKVGSKAIVSGEFVLPERASDTKVHHLVQLPWFEKVKVC